MLWRQAARAIVQSWGLVGTLAVAALFLGIAYLMDRSDKKKAIAEAERHRERL